MMTTMAVAISLIAKAAHILFTLAPHTLSPSSVQMAPRKGENPINAPSLTASAMTNSTAAPQINVQMPKKKAMECH